jgi:hypothetical protein
MNVGIGTESAQFLFWDYLIRIFGKVLQCIEQMIFFKLKKYSITYISVAS